MLAHPRDTHRDRLEPARQAIVKLYNATFLPNVPGAQALRRLSRAPLSTSFIASERPTVRV